MYGIATISIQSNSSESIFWLITGSDELTGAEKNGTLKLYHFRLILCSQFD